MPIDWLPFVLDISDSVVVWFILESGEQGLKGGPGHVHSPAAVTARKLGAGNWPGHLGGHPEERSFVWVVVGDPSCTEVCRAGGRGGIGVWCVEKGANGLGPGGPSGLV